MFSLVEYLSLLFLTDEKLKYAIFVNDSVGYKAKAILQLFICQEFLDNSTFLGLIKWKEFVCM